MTAAVERVGGKGDPGEREKEGEKGERPSSFSLREIKSRTAGVEKQLYMSSTKIWIQVCGMDGKT